MSPFAAVRTCFKKFFQFSGRASRPEFWWFALVGFAVVVAAGAADIARLGPQPGTVYRTVFVPGQGIVRQPLDVVMWRTGLLFMVAVLAFATPLSSVAARRMHDTGRRARWLLLPPGLFLLSIVLAVFVPGLWIVAVLTLIGGVIVTLAWLTHPSAEVDRREAA